MAGHFFDIVNHFPVFSVREYRQLGWRRPLRRKPDAPMSLSPIRLITNVSVRTRIAVLALIPVVGFIANGVAFMTGESEVEDAFGIVRNAAVLSDASREFRGSLAAMGVRTREFAATNTRHRRRNNRIRNF